MLLKAECREVYAASEDFGFRQNTHTSNTVNFHFHVRVAVRVAKIGKMRTPCSVLCVSLDDHSILVECIREGQCGFGLLPTVQVIRLFASQPVGQWSPDI